MRVVKRIADRIRTSFGRFLSEWDEADVVEAACCAPDHLVPSGDDPSDGEASSDGECRCCGS